MVTGLFPSSQARQVILRAGVSLRTLKLITFGGNGGAKRGTERNRSFKICFVTSYANYPCKLEKGSKNIVLHQVTWLYYDIAAN